VPKQPVPAPSEQQFSRAERLVGVWFITFVGLALLAIIALIIANVHATGPVWAVVALIPLVALPLGFVMAAILLILGTRRRSRAAKGASK
jgi:Mn2+/Fe2+ NRAMP family transporter